MTRHFLADDDLSPAELEEVLDLADVLKKDRYAGPRVFEGRAIAVIFEKPSTRTRLSFEVGIGELGAHPVIIDSRMSQLGRGETIEDTARVLSRYCSMIVIRTFAQDIIERLAGASDVPVVNALTDYAHPCQALADLQTIREHKGGLSGLTLTYLGDGNNVAHSLLLAGAAAGMRVRVATPRGYEPIEAVVRRANAIGEQTGGTAVVMTDPMEAATGADVLYTDVWASMGQEAEHDSRMQLFAGFALDELSIEAAADGVLVMHCLPAHRGEEISAGALDGPHSVVWDQAENRLHAQKALMTFLDQHRG